MGRPWQEETDKGVSYTELPEVGWCQLKLVETRETRVESA